MAIVLNNTQLYPTEEDKEEEEYLAAAAAEAKAREEAKKREEGDSATKDDDASGPTDMATDDEDDSKKESSTIIMPPGKQKVSPIPDVTVHIRNTEQDEYIAVCCDGIWDVLSNQQFVVELDAIMYAEGERDLGLISEEILDTCLRYGSKDNMTAIVVQLPGCEKSYADAKAKATTDSTEQNGVMGRRRIRQQQEEEKSAEEAGSAQGAYGQDSRFQDGGNMSS